MSFTEQHSKATNEIRSKKELLSQKEVYEGEPVQGFTPVKEKLRTSYEKIEFLESSLEPLKVSYDVAKAKKKNLRTEVDQWKKMYDALENKLVMDLSWTYLCTRFETLIEASQEGFDLNAEIAKAKEAIEVSQKGPSFSTPEEEYSGGDMGKEDMETKFHPPFLCP